eukprot:1158662-Pelagomonas_calceolata.AAC.8
MLSRHLVPLFHAVGMPRHALPMAPCVGRPSATPALSLFAVAARRKTSDSAPPEPTVHAAEAPATKRGKSSKAASKDSASLPQSAEGPPSLGDPPEAPASGAKAQPAPAAAAPARAAGQASAPPAAATTSAEATHLPGEPADEDKPQEKAPRAKPVPTQPPTRAKEQELWDQVASRAQAARDVCDKTHLFKRGMRLKLISSVILQNYPCTHSFSKLLLASSTSWAWTRQDWARRQCSIVAQALNGWESWGIMRYSFCHAIFRLNTKVLQASGNSAITGNVLQEASQGARRTSFSFQKLFFWGRGPTKSKEHGTDMPWSCRASVQVEQSKAHFIA